MDGRAAYLDSLANLRTIKNIDQERNHSLVLIRYTTKEATYVQFSRKMSLVSKKCLIYHF